MKEDLDYKKLCFTKIINISKNALTCIRKEDIAGAFLWLKKRRAILQQCIDTTVLELEEYIRKDLEAALQHDSVLKNEICSQQKFLEKELDKIAMILKTSRWYSAGSLRAKPRCIDKEA